MPDAYTNLLVHVVFSTKNRDTVLTADVRRELYPYLASLAKECRAKAYAVNGGLDHVHLMANLPPTLTVSDFMKFLKANSSRWIRGRFHRTFAWQAGYGAFSVSHSRRPQVCAYIDGQEQHSQARELRQRVRFTAQTQRDRI
jgi:REP element-mobilizing transposase RayT